jgi:hypothetical protein
MKSSVEKETTTEVEAIAIAKKAVREVTILEKRVADEAAMKAIEEEKIKKDKEVIDNDASPMDIEIHGSSLEIPLTRSYPLVDELGLGLHTPYKPNKVENFKRFKFDEAIDRIVQQQTQKILFIGGNPLSVVTETLVIEDVSKDPLSIAHPSTTFIVEIEKNLKNLFCQNEEKDIRIRELEQQLRHTNKDKEILMEFNVGTLRGGGVNQYEHIYYF